MVLLDLALTALLALAGVWVVRRRRRQRVPTPPRPAITLQMQAKMARSVVTLVTSGGRRALPQGRAMARSYRLTTAHFVGLAVPPEEDAAREYVVSVW